MKSVKMFFGMMLCLVVLAGQAQATIDPINLNFELPNSLQYYESNYGITFSDWKNLTISSNRENTELFGYQILEVFGKDTSINFSPERSIISFDYRIVGGTVSFFDGAVSQVLNAGVNTYTFASDLLLSSIKFDITNAEFYLDNVTVSSVPLPGAAILLGSGLLGLVGLRRREII